MRVIVLLVLAALAVQVRLKPDTTSILCPAEAGHYVRSRPACRTLRLRRSKTRSRSPRILPRLHSLLVSRRGELVLERYFIGARAARPANVKSASKSIISALVGIAIDRRLIAGVETPIVTYFPELKKDRDDEAADHDRKSVDHAVGSRDDEQS